MALPSVHPDTPRNLRPGPNIFTEEEIRSLEEDAIFLPQAEPATLLIAGKRKVSAAFSTGRAISASSASSSSSSASIETRGFEANELQTFDIPLAEESVEVLECIGFQSNTARIIYDRYFNRPDPDRNADDLMAYVNGHISSLWVAPLIDMNHREAMGEIGLTVGTQAAITDPRFSHIFGTQSLHYWVRDTVETNYAALLGKQALLKNHVKKKKNKRPGREANLPHADPPTQPAITATINLTPADFQFPEAHVALQNDADILSGHLSLYKGKAYAELHTAGQFIRKDGSLNMDILLSDRGGDFNSSTAVQYWSPERETGEEYRKYAARRSPRADTCIIHIQVPWTFVRLLHMKELWFSPPWKEYVWSCRRRERPHSKFDHLWRPGQTDILKGHICSTVNRQILRIPQEHVQTHRTNEHTMRLPEGRKATQVVFMQPEAIDRLGEQIKGKVHFLIVAATGTTR